MHISTLQLPGPGVSAIERQGLGGLCCVRMDAYKLDHGERHPHKSLKTEARADKNLPAAHRRGRDPAGIPRIPPGSGGRLASGGTLLCSLRQSIDLETGFRVVRFFLKTLCEKYFFSYKMQVAELRDGHQYIDRVHPPSGRD